MNWIRTGRATLAALLLLPAAALAQQARPPLPADATQVLGPGYVYDAGRSEADLESTRATLRAVFPAWMLEGDNLSVRVYRYDGDLETALGALRLTDAFPAPTGVQTASVGQGLQMMLGMFEEMARAMYGDAWIEEARREIPRLNQVRQQTFQVGAGEEPAPDGRGMVRGRMVSLSGSSPYLDTRALEVVDGSWVHLVEVRYAVSEERTRAMMAEEGEEGADDPYDGEDGPTAGPGPEAIGAPLYAGLAYFDTSDLMSPPRGATFTVRASVDAVTDFYRGVEGLYCETSYEYRPTREERDEGYGTSVELFCLDHPGEPVDDEEGLEVMIAEPDRETREEVEDMTDLWIPEGTVWVSFFRRDRELR